MLQQAISDNADGNMKDDGVWTHTCNTENRLVP